MTERKENCMQESPVSWFITVNILVTLVTINLVFKKNLHIGIRMATQLMQHFISLKNLL